MDNEFPAKRTAAQLIAYYFDLLNLIFVSVVAVYMTYFCLNTNSEWQLDWHTWLCTIGYQVLMAEGILTFYQMNALTLSISRQRRKTIHWVLQTIGFVITFLGILFEYLLREKKSRGHFTTSVHSVTGSIAFIFSIVALINGVMASKSWNLRQYIRPIHSKFFHNFVGIASFVIGMVSLYYGYDRGNMRKYSRKDIRLALQALTILTILLSLVGPLRSLWKQVRVIFTK